MNKKALTGILAGMAIIMSTGGCGRAEGVQEEAITYDAWLDGCWESKDLLVFCNSPVSLSMETAVSLIGKKYDFSMPREGEAVGGAVPIRDINTQYFFFVEFPYTLAELGLEGSYYPIVHIDKEGFDGGQPCLIIKDRNEYLLTENCAGVYIIQRTEPTDEVKQNVYERDLTFEENVRKRMEIQGIKYDYYYRGVWKGNWMIQEVVSTDDMQEAQKHIGETVSYITAVDYWDIQFIDSAQDRIFYNMPMTGELGLEGSFYLLVLDSDHEYPVIIVKSEHEIFLVTGNTVYRATQEGTYLNETLLQGG